MINDIDFSYGFIYEHADLVNNLYENYKYDLAIKLYCNFVLPIINITKDEHIKEYNEHVENLYLHLLIALLIYIVITHLIFLYWDVLITLLILIVIVQKIMVNVFELLKEIIMV